MIFDTRPCELGEGALWHPVREQLFWFDILNRTMHSQVDGKPLSWTFNHFVSAAGWISKDELLIASEIGLFRFHLGTGERAVVAEAGTPATRSNDGRADRLGGLGRPAAAARLRLRGAGVVRLRVGLRQDGATPQLDDLDHHLLGTGP